MRVKRHSQYGSDRVREQREESTTFVGMRSSGTHSLGTVNPQEIEHEDISHPSDHERNLIRNEFANDPFLYAFGTGSRLLNERDGPNEDTLRWEAERIKDAQGKELYWLKRVIPTESGPLAFLTFVVDPARGWLVVRRQFHATKDQLAEETQITPAQEATSGRWYPVEVRHVRYDSDPAGKPVIAGTVHTVVQKFRADVAYPPEQFTIESLDLPVGVRLRRTTTGGELVTLLKTEQGLNEVGRRSLMVQAELPPAPPFANDGPVDIVQEGADPMKRWVKWLIGLFAVGMIGAALALLLNQRKKGGTSI